MLSHIAHKIKKLFSPNTIDTMSESTIAELERILIQADTGFTTTQKIIKHIRAQVQTKSNFRPILEQELRKILDSIPAYCEQDAHIHILVGINGSGKTTAAGKLAHYYSKLGKKVLLVAADTFRAAAQQQLAAWAAHTNSAIVLAQAEESPSTVVFRACDLFLTGDYDKLIIDTSGRLQTKTELMHELSKIKRTIEKKLGTELPGKKINTLLTVDSMLGQNSLEQAKLFHESTQLTGIIVTKLDGSGKAGIVSAIYDQIKIPVAYVSNGESQESFMPFDAAWYIQHMLGTEHE